MPIYEVTIKEIEIYVIDEIEANSEDEAKEMAWELITDDEGKQKYHNDSDGKSEALELAEK